jgi:hypothetical protein
MKTGKGLTTYGIILAGMLGIFLAMDRINTSDSKSIGQSVHNTIGEKPLEFVNSAISNSIEAQQDGSSLSASNAGRINNGGQFTEATAELVDWVEAGHPLDIQIGDLGRTRIGFRERSLVSDDFQISQGADSAFPSEFRVFSGRQMGADAFLEDASLAVVNGAFSLTLTRDGQHFLIETDPESGDLYAVALHSFDNPHSCGSGSCGEHHTVCQVSPDSGMAVVEAPVGSESAHLDRIPVSVVFPGDRVNAVRDFESAEESTIEASTAGDPYIRNGTAYDASLKDIMILTVSSKSKTGPTSGLSSKAATYFAIAARSAELYERQLGMRYLMQELILIPSDSSESDPGNPSGTTLGDDLYHFQSWINSNRPQSTYKWGHAALWTIVYNSGGGTIGLAWTDGYGSSYGMSVQEPNWGWEVHTHELGHNVGSTHSSGGVMNASHISGAESFYKVIPNQSYTAAMDIYNYMSYPSRPYVYGPAALRHPEEIPFGVDDSLTTPADTSVTFDPLLNDQASVPYGAANSLSLEEIGQVLPKSAGQAMVVDGQIEFIPAVGFTGQAWFSYTLRGSLGNSGYGWLHRADVIITVGGSSAAPLADPVLELSNDFISSDLLSPVRLNPLLNDQGSGRLWSGDVEVVLSPSDTTPESYTESALHLVGASILTGTGTLSLETRNMVRSSSSTTEYSGYLTYTPGASESGEVVIEYTVQDTFGRTGTAHIILAEEASVSVNANYLTVAEDSGDVIELTFNRSSIADLSQAETIEFSEIGTATPVGLQPDFAFAGHDSFDPTSGLGTVVIPAGETSSTVLMAIADDGISEGQETMHLAITATSSLIVSDGAGEVTVWINDNSLVYEENFSGFTSDEATWNGWSNAKNMRTNGKGGEDWFDWSMNSGSTPTAGTGPSADHTNGFGKYLYAEATSQSDKFAILQSPVISAQGIGAGAVEFWYNMFGSGIGTLSVDLYVDGVLITPSIWSASGQQSSSGSDWKRAAIEISDYLPAQTIQVKFRVDTTSSDIGDVAIDDFAFSALSSSLPQSPNILADPAGCKVDAGESVYLSVIPEGFPAPQVQWYRNGVAIPGATGAAYFINAVDESTTGTYEVTVSNTEGQILSIPADIELLSLAPPPSVNIAYNSWASANLDETNWDENDDPDGDGIINLFEFAFEMDPLVPSQGGLPAVSYSEFGGVKYLEITFARRVDYATEGVDYTVETSASLNAEDWVSGNAVQEVSSETVEGITYVTYRRTAAINSNPGFLRVNVVAGSTPPPPPPPPPPA